MQPKETEKTDKKVRTQLSEIEKAVQRNSKPFYVGNVGEHYEIPRAETRMHTAESLISVARTALLGLELEYGDTAIGEYNLPTSLSDIANCLELAQKLLPYDEVTAFDEIKSTFIPATV